MPNSCITAMASGRTRLGFTPALKTSKRSPASWRSRASAIWLRAEFPVHRIRTRFFFINLDAKVSVGPAPPSEKHYSSAGPRQLCDDEWRGVGGTDAGERITRGAGQGNRGIGEGRRRGEPVGRCNVGADGKW